MMIIIILLLYRYDTMKSKIRSKSFSEIVKVLESCSEDTWTSVTTAVRQLLFRSGKKSFHVPSDLTTEFPVVQVFAPSAPSDYGPPSTLEEEDQ
jgi:hypothetical protein